MNRHFTRAQTLGTYLPVKSLRRIEHFERTYGAEPFFEHYFRIFHGFGESNVDRVGGPIVIPSSELAVSNCYDRNSARFRPLSIVRLPSSHFYSLIGRTSRHRSIGNFGPRRQSAGQYRRDGQKQNSHFHNLILKKFPGRRLLTDMSKKKRHRHTAEPKPVANISNFFSVDTRTHDTGHMTNTKNRNFPKNLYPNYQTIKID